MLPVLSKNHIYNYINRTAVEKALQLIEDNQTAVVVVIAAAARALFHLHNDYSIDDLPESKNYDAVLSGLDKSVSRLVASGKQVIVLVDNPTLPHPEDCLVRKTSSSFFNELLAAPLNAACQITIAKQLELSKQYRDMLFNIYQETSSQRCFIVRYHSHFV